RRHTRSYGDWSSDVCSSDLREQRVELVPVLPAGDAVGEAKVGGPVGVAKRIQQATPCPIAAHVDGDPAVISNRRVHAVRGVAGKIGRASCRERVEMSGCAGM